MKEPSVAQEQQELPVKKEEAFPEQVVGAYQVLAAMVSRAQEALACPEVAALA